MLWVGSKPIDVYLSHRTLRLVENDEIICQRDSNETHGALSLVEHLQSWRQSTNKKMNIWLSGSLCRPTLVYCPKGLNDANEFSALAEAAMRQQHGTDENLLVWTGQVTPERDNLVAAIPAWLPNALASVRLKTLSPWWSMAFNQVQSEDRPTVLSVEDDEAVTLLASQDNHFQLASTITPLSTGSATRSALSRLLFSAGIEPTAILQLKLDFETKADVSLAAQAVRLPLARWTSVST